MKRLWIALLLLTACAVQSVQAQPFASSVIHLPTVGRDAARAKPPGPEQVVSLGKGAGATYGLDCEGAASAGIEWWYNWHLVESAPAGGAPCPGIEFVCMIWDEKGIGQPLSENCTWVLEFNERKRWAALLVLAITALMFLQSVSLIPKLGTSFARRTFRQAKRCRSFTRSSRTTQTRSWVRPLLKCGGSRIRVLGSSPSTVNRQDGTR